MGAVPESSLAAGLTALEKSDFDRAIALLEAVCQNPAQPMAIKVQAQQGLVTAYIAKKADNRAIFLLQTLNQSNDPQIKAWIANNYPQLIKAPTDITGFVAFDEKLVQPAKVVIDKNVVPPIANEDREVVVTENILTPVEEAKEEISAPTPFQWRHAPRAKRWQALKEVNFVPLWLLMAGSAIALFWLMREVLLLVMLFINDLLVKLPYLEPFQPFYHDPSNLLRLLVIILTITSPWLLDRLLALNYDSQVLTIDRLAKYSPESERVLQRFCRQQGWRLPKLIIFPTSAPIALTYGNLRRTARIAVSQGLLEQLADDEIASIYAAQLGQIASWDFAVMSLFMAVTQSVYTVYRQISTWGDFATNSAIRIAAATIASTAYGLWWLFCLPGLWLSQLRIYYSDFFATNLTGNPNGLTRALIKIAIGIAKDVQQKECTSWLLESTNLFIPVGYYQAITLGSLHIHTNIELVLAWDCQNPYRYLLNINNTHPLMGDRLQRLNTFAQYWRLETELKLPPQTNRLASTIQELLLQLKSLLTNRALVQFAAVFGLIFGLISGGFTWLVGAMAYVVWIPQLAWMYGDWLLIKAFMPIALSISLFLRINFLFPDITPASVRATPNLARQLAVVTALPIDSHPVRWQGKLLGRRGIANWLGQDLLLNSSQGLIKLHYQSPLGTIGHIFFRQSLNPMDLLGRHIMVAGWFRRSATTWIDINLLQTQTGKVSHSSQPLWATLAASAIALYGTAIIIWGR